jgi:hypothetical protein
MEQKMDKYKKSYSMLAVNRKNKYASKCGASGGEGAPGFQPGNTCGGDGDGRDTSGDQGGGDHKSNLDERKKIIGGAMENLDPSMTVWDAVSELALADHEDDSIRTAAEAMMDELNYQGVVGQTNPDGSVLQIDQDSILGESGGEIQEFLKDQIADYYFEDDRTANEILADTGSGEGGGDVKKVSGLNKESRSSLEKFVGYTLSGDEFDGNVENLTEADIQTVMDRAEDLAYNDGLDEHEIEELRELSVELGLGDDIAEEAMGVEADTGTGEGGGKTRGDWTSETVQDEVENLEGMSFDSKSELKDHLDTLYHYEGEEGEHLTQGYVDDVWDKMQDTGVDAGSEIDLDDEAFWEATVEDFDRFMNPDGTFESEQDKNALRDSLMSTHGLTRESAEDMISDKSEEQGRYYQPATGADVGSEQDDLIDQSTAGLDPDREEERRANIAYYKDMIKNEQNNPDKEEREANLAYYQSELDAIVEKAYPALSDDEQMYEGEAWQKYKDMGLSDDEASEAMYDPEHPANTGELNKGDSEAVKERIADMDAQGDGRYEVGTLSGELYDEFIEDFNDYKVDLPEGVSPKYIYELISDSSRSVFQGHDEYTLANDIVNAMAHYYDFEGDGYNKEDASYIETLLATGGVDVKDARDIAQDIVKTYPAGGSEKDDADTGAGEGFDETPGADAPSKEDIEAMEGLDIMQPDTGAGATDSMSDEQYEEASEIMAELIYEEGIMKEDGSFDSERQEMYAEDTLMEDLGITRELASQLIELNQEQISTMNEDMQTTESERSHKPPKDMTAREELLYNEPDGDNYIHLTPKSGKFIDGGEFDEQENKVNGRILDIIGRNRLNVTDKGIIFDNLSKSAMEQIMRTLRNEGMGAFADTGSNVDDW